MSALIGRIGRPGGDRRARTAGAPPPTECEPDRAARAEFVICERTIEIISHCVWLYYCLPLSYRQVELVMAQRGITLTYEAIRQWCRKFGQQYATELKRRRPQPGDKWHLDEVFLKINGVNIIYGAQSISMEPSSIYLCSPGVIGSRPCGSFVSS